MPNKSMMKLDKSSGMAQMKSTMSECILEEMKQGGHTREQAIAMCSSMIKERTGKDIFGSK